MSDEFKGSDTVSQGDFGGVFNVVSRQMMLRAGRKEGRKAIYNTGSDKCLGSSCKHAGCVKLYVPACSQCNSL